MTDSTRAKGKRNHATFATDYLLVEETLNKNPFLSAKPADTWQEIATNLAGTQKFKAQVTARYCQDRIDVLLNLHDQDETANLKRSGTVEDFGNFQEMLGELSSLRKTSQTNALAAKTAKAKERQEGDQVAEEVVAVGETTFSRSKEGSSARDNWEDDLADSEEEKRLEEENPNYIRRKRKTANTKCKARKGRMDFSEGDMAVVFAKQDELKFEHKKLELQQQKELKELELRQEKELREKEIASRDLEVQLQHEIKMKELDLEREKLELRKREMSLLEKR